jgi:Cu(I)/Ag(I) efflux system membrane fusion protein
VDTNINKQSGKSGNQAMKTKYATLLVAAIGLAAAPALLAQGCCESGGMKQGCSMGGMMSGAGHEAAAAPAANTTVKPVFMQPVQSVFDTYIKVQQTLAQDSVEGVASAGAAMAKAIQGDSMKMLPPAVAQQSEALAKAKDVDSARAAFKALSESLIEYVNGQKAATGTYHVAYCPMAKASWLQTGLTITNPYMGKSMQHCGQFKT